MSCACYLPIQCESKDVVYVYVYVYLKQDDMQDDLIPREAKSKEKSPPIPYPENANDHANLSRS